MISDTESETDLEISSILGGKEGPCESDILPVYGGCKVSPVGSDSSEGNSPECPSSGFLFDYGIIEDEVGMPNIGDKTSLEFEVIVPQFDDPEGDERDESNLECSSKVTQSDPELGGTMDPSLLTLDMKAMVINNRSSSFNSTILTPNSLSDFDRSLSISLEELMENIQVPQTGQKNYGKIANLGENDLIVELNGSLVQRDGMSENTNHWNEVSQELPEVTDDESAIDDEECNNEEIVLRIDEDNIIDPSCAKNDHDSSRKFLQDSHCAVMDQSLTHADHEPLDLTVHLKRSSEGKMTVQPSLVKEISSVTLVPSSPTLNTSSLNYSKRSTCSEKSSTSNTSSTTLNSKSLTLDLSKDEQNINQDNNGSRQTPEYCRELSSLTLGAGDCKEMKKDEDVKDPGNNNILVKLSRPRCAKEISPEILFSGIVTFPDCHDNSCRPILFVHASTSRWQNLGKLEIARLMLYLISSSPCITLLVHLENGEMWPLIKEAVLLFQWNRPGVISQIIFLAKNREFLPEEDLFKAQCTVVQSIVELDGIIDSYNLPEILGGIKKYNHENWIQQRLELESYVLLCETLQHNFTTNTVAMTTSAMPMTLQETADMLNRHRSTMTELLDDTKVRDLHDMGHQFLTQLKREENQTYADQIHSSYESVCSAIQRYVQVADERLLALERHLLVKQFEESCNKILSWASDRRNELKTKFGEVADSLNDLRKQRQEFDGFYLEVVKQYAQCDCLLSEANQLSSSGFLGQVNSHAQNAAEQISRVVQDMEMKKEEVETASQLYLFVDQAYSWALTGMKFVASLNMSEDLTIEQYDEQISKYDEYMTSHPPIPTERFKDMREVAIRFNNLKCQRQCETAQQKCNETKELFRKRRRLLVKARDHQLGELRKKSGSISPSSKTDENSNEKSSEIESNPSTESNYGDNYPLTNSRPLLRQNSDISHKIRPPGSNSNNNNGGIPPQEGLAESATATLPSKHRPKKMLRKSQSMLSHSSTNPRLRIGSPMRNHEPDTHGRSKWSLAIEELILTEIEYVKSLDYIIEHYYPLMNQLDDVPQALRGKRGVVFGNIENIRDFHAGQFVDSLQTCRDQPARVAEVFIQHRDSFSMYALYSKNKPRSDELMREHGTRFFRNKQLQLRDKMDLASYLLKPVQRMGKYALLLHNIGKHCDIRYRSMLKEAESLVKFQLRHGNDLLAMDSITNCDVNLKEQGELRRQEEFFVFQGRRKYLRHIFLFDDMILMSKPQRVHGGHDLYHYKSSYKTAEIGLTENIGDTGLKFEIWFRRPMQDSFILHASSENKKAAWVEEIRSILWKQALRNKESRRSEMINMGIGSKPHLDIRSSKSPITDRSVASERLMRVLPSRTRNSIAVSTFDHACKRPHSTVSTSSTSSNGSFQMIPPTQPASMFDFRAIVEGEEYESGSGRGSSLCTSSNGDADPLVGDEAPGDGRPQQYVTTV